MEGENFRRSIRSTAGNRYQALLATEDTEKDDFYSTQYGGFVDVKSDDDFRSESSSSDDTITESSSNEDESDGDGAEEPEKEQKKKRKLAYRDPAREKASKSAKNEQKSPKQKRRRDSGLTNESRRSSRRHTTEQRHELEQTLKQREISEKKKKTKRSETKKMTQEEIMAEALKTEEINLSQLVIYQQMEQQRKNKFRRKKTKCVEGPSVKTISKLHSVIPLDPASGAQEQKPDTKVESLIIFSHKETFKEIFPKRKPKIPKRDLCVVTGKPARYRTRDGIPYSDSAAFKLLQKRQLAKEQPMEMN